MSPARVAALVIKEWREILRDRIYFFLAFLLPFVMMIVFGYGMSQETDNIAFALIDHDRTALSREYSYRFIDSRYFDFKGHVGHADRIEALLAGGEVQLVFVIPEGFQERLSSGRTSEVQTLIDGTFTMTVRPIDGYVQAINAAFSGDLQVRYIARGGAMSPRQAGELLQPVGTDTRYLYNQELRSIWSVAPTLVMFILMVTAPMLMALSVVREKETGTIYNIYASTISRTEYLLGKLIPNALVSFVNGLILTLMAIVYFGAPFKGSFPFFVTALFVYACCASCLGLLISLWVKTQMAAILVTIVAAFVITMQFSGMNTPVSSMTGLNWYLAHAFPAKYFNDIVSATFLKGSGLDTGWPDLLALCGFTVGLFVIAWLLFHKRERR